MWKNFLFTAEKLDAGLERRRSPLKAVSPTKCVTTQRISVQVAAGGILNVSTHMFLWRVERLTWELVFGVDNTGFAKETD